MLKLIFIPLIFGSVFFAGDSKTVADKIIEFSMKNLNKKVGTGECWDLASEALNNANADWSSPFNFGTKVDINKAQRADILQFTDIKIEFEFGSMSFPQHTAIVYKANKKLITLLHQNFNNKRAVDTITINLRDIKNGKIEAFRPKARG